MRTPMSFLSRIKGFDYAVHCLAGELIASGETKGQLAIVATKSSFGKCERCWNYRDAVGKDATHPTLCDRCVEAVQ